MKLIHEKEMTQASDECKNANSRHVAVKVWSELLQAQLWVVADEQDIEVFTTHGLTGEICTVDEIQKYSCIDRDSIKALHTILFDN
jgi:hypothetical protein